MVRKESSEWGKKTPSTDSSDVTMRQEGERRFDVDDACKLPMCLFVSFILFPNSLSCVEMILCPKRVGQVVSITTADGYLI